MTPLPASVAPGPTTSARRSTLPTSRARRAVSKRPSPSFSSPSSHREWRSPPGVSSDSSAVLGTSADHGPAAEASSTAAVSPVLPACSTWTDSTSSMKRPYPGSAEASAESMKAARVRVSATSKALESTENAGSVAVPGSNAPSADSPARRACSRSSISPAARIPLSYRTCSASRSARACTAAAAGSADSRMRCSKGSTWKVVRRSFRNSPDMRGGVATGLFRRIKRGM